MKNSRGFGCVIPRVQTVARTDYNITRRGGEVRRGNILNKVTHHLINTNIMK